MTLYDAATGTAGKVFSTHGGALNALAYLPDGSGLLAAGGAGVVHHWKLPGGEPALPVRGHAAPVRAVAFLPGGGVVTGGEDGFVVVYDPAGREARRFRAHAPPATGPSFYGLTALAPSPDGTRVYTAGEDGAVRAWDVATGKLAAERRVSTPAARPLALAVSADGKRLAAGMRWDGVKLLSAEKLADEVEVAADGVCAGVAFAAGGRLVAASDKTRATAVWALDPPAEVRRVRTTAPPDGPARARPPWRVYGEPSSALAVSPDGALFTGPSDGGGADGAGPTLGVWTVAGGNRVFRVDLGAEPALCAAFVADGKRVAVGSADGAVRVFELATGAVRHTFRGHRGPVLCLAASADGKQLVSGGLDTTAVVWAVP